jgi:hypothetical protein
VKELAQGVSFDRPLDRRLVHRRATAEVLVTSAAEAGDHRYVCGVQVSASHRRMPMGPGVVPASLVLEASRQAGIAISHLYLDVPLEQQYLLDRLNLTWVDGLIPVTANTPIEAMLDVRVTKGRRERKQVHSLSFAGSWFVDEREVARATAEMRYVPPGTFRALRRIHAAATLPARPTDGRSRDFDRTLVVGWNPHDPMLFDHPVDHVPGMALIDAGLAAAGPTFQAFDVEFLAFAELDVPLCLREERSDRLLRTYVIDQNDSAIARLRVTSPG